MLVAFGRDLVLVVGYSIRVCQISNIVACKNLGIRYRSINLLIRVDDNVEKG